MELIKIMNYLQANEIDFDVEKATYHSFTNLVINVEYGDMRITLNQKGKFDVYYDCNTMYGKLYNLSFIEVRKCIIDVFIGND